jgi:exopolyphosphatase/pppGpp-phosphohydrolase
MEKLKLNKIHLPRVGLKEGIVLSMIPDVSNLMGLKD